MPTKKILLVEDDPFLSFLLKNRLEKEQYQIFLAKDGEEAINLVGVEHPDLVLLDIILPKKSGFEVMEEIRQNPETANASIIIISNLGQPEDVTKGQSLGAIEYFIKAKTPIDDLIVKIKGFLNQPEVK